MSRPVIIATQLPEAAIRPFLGDLADIKIRTIGADFSTLEPDVECLIPLPATHIGTLACPTGWPRGVRWVQLLSAGLDGYPDWLLRDVKVTAMQGVNADAVAEYAMAALLAGAKRFPDIWRESREWQQAPLGDLSGSTLGIVGFGAIGQAVAQRANAFGMNIQAIRASDKPMPDYVGRADSLRALFATSDHVVLAAPASADTRNMIDADLLTQARPGLHLINLARGELVDEAALLAALDNGQVSRATLDVLAKEPPAADHPLLHHPRAFVSAHVAAHSPGVMQAMGRRIRANIDAFRAGGALIGVIAL